MNSWMKGFMLGVLSTITLLILMIRQNDMEYLIGFLLGMLVVQVIDSTTILKDKKTDFDKRRLKR